MREGFIPSYYLIKRLESENPDHQFRLVIGSDLVQDLHTWDEGASVLSHIRFLIIPRIPYLPQTSKCEDSAHVRKPSNADFQALGGDGCGKEASSPPVSCFSLKSNPQLLYRAVCAK